MAVTFYNAYQLRGRELVEQPSRTTPVSAFVGGPAWARVLRGEAVLDVDVAMMLRHETNIDFTQALAVFLESRLSDLALPRYTTQTLPKLSGDGRFAQRLAVLDAHASAGVTVAYTSLATPDTRNDPHARGRSDELVLTLPDGVLAEHCLVAVNGVFHRTLPWLNNELFVVEGFANIKNRGRRAVTLVNTGPLGGHTTIPLTADMIANQPGQDLWHGVYLQLPRHLDLSGHTLLLVLDGRLHALDGSYRLVGPNRLKIHTPRIDLVNDFLHNPNTPYMHNGSGQPVPEHPYQEVPKARPSALDKIRHYIRNLHPMARTASTRAAVIEYRYADQFATDTPLVLDRMRHYIEHVFPKRDRKFRGAGVSQYRFQPLFPAEPPIEQKLRWFIEHRDAFNAERGDAGAGVTQYRYAKDYHTTTAITKVMPALSFRNPEFVAMRVASRHSFLIAIPHAHVFARRMPLTPQVASTQYETMRADTPRGLLRYAGTTLADYLVRSAPDGQHTVSLGHHKPYLDLYQTSIEPLGVPSPLFDATSPAQRHPVEFLELYRGA